MGEVFGIYEDVLGHLDLLLAADLFIELYYCVNRARKVKKGSKGLLAVPSGTRAMSYRTKTKMF